MSKSGRQWRKCRLRKWALESLFIYTECRALFLRASGATTSFPDDVIEKEAVKERLRVGECPKAPCRRKICFTDRAARARTREDESEDSPPVSLRNFVLCCPQRCKTGSRRELKNQEWHAPTSDHNHDIFNSINFRDLEDHVQAKKRLPKVSETDWNRNDDEYSFGCEIGMG